MENLRDLIGCRCHANAFFEKKVPGEKTPAHTFPWAKRQYNKERPVWPTSQSLDLRLDIDGEELSGSNTIQFKVMAQEVKSFLLDAVDLKIHDVQINSKPVKFEVGTNAVEIYLDKSMKRGEAGVLKATYTCHKPKCGIYFIKPDKEYPDRPTQVWTQGQDDDAKYWFPSFDEPRVKCAFELKVEVPSGFLAISNGILHSESRGGKTWTFNWKTNTLIPSYLVTLAVGRFAEIRDEWRGKPVTYYCEKGREAEAKLSFGKTPQMMEHFSQVIGVDYPYEKYAQIAAAEFIFGGMENTSATTQTDATLHPYEIEEDFTSDDLVSHELAHQWFGDLVTCKSWAHGWLNEGWATFMETVFKEKDLGVDETDYFRFEELNIYMAEDKGLYRRPVVTDFYADPGEVWDRHIYQKGGLVLHMLRGNIGADDFWTGTKNYLNYFKGGVVETVDFQRALELASGKPLQKFFDQWIYKGGYPELKAKFSWDEKTKLGQFKLEQTQDVNDLTPVFDFTSKVEFFFKDQTSISLDVHLKDKTQTFYIPLKEKPSYCVFDRGNFLIKTIEWEMPIEMIKAQLEKDKDVVSKIWAMKYLTKEASKEGIEILSARLKSDEFWGVRAEAAMALADTKSTEALKVLLGALKSERRSKVRAKICSALGQFRDEGAADALADCIDNDKSIFVKGAASSALGKTKSPKAFEKLKVATATKSWNDLVGSQAFVGLRYLRDERATELFVKGSQYGSPKQSRMASILALGEYGVEKKDITEKLEEYLEDPFFRARFSAAEALARRKDPSTISSIEEAAHRITDGHFKAAAFRASRRLSRSLSKPAEFSEMKETLDKMSDENRKLRERIDKLEQTQHH